ncbi:quinone oxidoreductase [Kineosporia sp. R_H_3]|uniref:quinone oxidoreductase family protein n=1 Tax=Kineosporia sp. R_H_3 TaxID=1961848 RepID=UPI000B4A7C0E|nr:quinone oxidoreductase [Kineosporia sp. R_H_3]
MQVVRITATGGPEVLEVADVAPLAPAAGEVLVDVAAAGVNFIDTYVRSGLYPTPLPVVLGQEGAGTVSAVGAGVDDVRVGDVVAWAGGVGAYAQQSVRRAGEVVVVPPGVDPETAAAAMLQGMTAHYLVTDTFALGPGHRCLVHAGAGGVGLLLIQLAKQAGAEVFTTVGGPEKAELARGAGADHVIDYRAEDFAGAVERLAGPKALDVVYDGVGKDTFVRGLDLLRRRGLMVTFGNASGAPDPVPPLLLSQKGSLFLTRPTLGDYIATTQELRARAGAVLDLVAAGGLDVRVGVRLPLAQARQAHELLEGRRTTGKVLLVP